MEGELDSLTVKLQQVEQGRAELADQMSALRTALKESDLKCDDYESKTKMMNDRVRCVCVCVCVCPCMLAFVDVHMCVHIFQAFSRNAHDSS